MIRSKKYFKKSCQEPLLTMDSEEEPYYDDPNNLLAGTPNSRKPAPPSLVPKQKDISTVLYKGSNGKVTLAPELEAELKKRVYNPPKIALPQNDRRFITAPGIHKSHIGASMPNVSHARQPDSLRSHNKMQRNNHYGGLSQAHSSVPHRHRPNQNSPQTDSAYQCFCFFLLYMLLFAVLGLFVLYMFRPEWLNAHHTANSATVDNIRKEYSFFRRLLRAYCKDYLNGLGSEPADASSNNQLPQQAANVTQLNKKNNKNFIGLCKKFGKDIVDQDELNVMDEGF